MSWVTIIWAMIASAAVAEGIPNPWMLIGQLPFSPDDRTKKILYRGGGARQCHLGQPVYECSRGRLVLLSRLGLV